MQWTGLVRRAAIATGLLAAIALWSPSQAADPKPDAAIKNNEQRYDVYLSGRAMF